MAGNTVAEYMKKVETRMREESQRVAVYLDPQTDSRIKEVLDRFEGQFCAWRVFSY